MELFEVEIHRQELLQRVTTHPALDEVQRFTLTGVIEKTQNVQTLSAIFSFMQQVDAIYLDTTKHVVKEEVRVMEIKVKELMKTIEDDYHTVQRQELLRLMQELS